MHDIFVTEIVLDETRVIAAIGQIGERAKAGATRQAAARARIRPPCLDTIVETDCAVPC